MIFSSISAFSQEISEDSITTPFRKGRWLTGLSGSISSGSTRLDTASNKLFANQYAMDVSTGKFFKNRWLIGGIFRMQRDNSRQFVDLESESVLIAPMLGYYLSDNPQGSIYFLVAPGYASFRERTVVIVAGTPSQELLKGSGFGLLLSMGYAYVLHDRIGFNLGLGLSSTWANAEREIDQGRTMNKLNVFTGNLAFTFGFSVILDEFFF